MKKIKIFSVKTLAFSRSIRYTIKAIEKEVQAIMAKCSCCGLICHEPEFYDGLATSVWDCSEWTTKVI